MVDLIDIEIKTEPIELQEQPVLINEKLFDERMCAPNRRNSTSLCKKRTCGRIEMVTSNSSKIYNLNCIYCDVEFLISNWKQFVIHVEKDHCTTIATEDNLTILTKDYPINILESSVKTESTEFIVGFKELNSPNFVNTESNTSLTTERTTDLFKIEKRNKTEEKIADKSSYHHSKSKNEEESAIGDSAIGESFTKYSRDSGSDFSDQIDVKMPYLPSRQKSKKPKIDMDHISFKFSDASTVTDFLNMLKFYPILWHRRQGDKNSFDTALRKLCLNFNEKYKLTLTDGGIRKSITRFKTWYRGVADASQSSTLKNKYQEYFTLCTEIEEASQKIVRNCDNCKQFFFSDVDLKIHKFKNHRIGELPFKCRPCNYGFASAEKLAEHERKHDRKRSLFCKICNQGFYYESMLKSHEATHTDDYKKVCEICGKIFPTPAKYNRHKLHHGDPSEKCEICGKAFYEKWTLSEHMKSHLNKRQYECDICYKQFNRYNGLTIHRRGVHKIQSASTSHYVGSWA